MSFSSACVVWYVVFEIFADEVYMTISQFSFNWHVLSAYSLHLEHVQVCVVSALVVGLQEKLQD